MSKFELDNRLASDCHLVGDLEISRVLLMNDQQYPWFILVPRRADLRELIDLSEEERLVYYQESAQLSHMLKSVFKAEKLNIAALGNVVAQLHIHHIGRNSDDIAWPKPVWGACPAIPYDQTLLDETLKASRDYLGL